MIQVKEKPEERYRKYCETLCLSDTYEMNIMVE